MICPRILFQGNEAVAKYSHIPKWLGQTIYSCLSSHSPRKEYLMMPSEHPQHTKRSVTEREKVPLAFRLTHLSIILSFEEKQQSNPLDVTAKVFPFVGPLPQATSIKMDSL
jgi:hypothetical protein